MTNETQEATVPMIETENNETTQPQNTATTPTENIAPAPIELTPTQQAMRDLKVDPDPLLTAAYVPSDEERMFRSRMDDHTRLRRKHKPAITPERAQELKDRMAEARAVYEQSITERRAGNGAKADELEKQCELRRLTYVDSLQLHFFEQNGLLTEEDLRALRAADDRRFKRRVKNIQNRGGDVQAFVDAYAASAPSRSVEPVA